MPSSLVRFAATRGQELAGRLEMPAGKPRAYALFSHCFTCSKDSKGAAFVSQALAARGIAVLRFDFTGLGQSGGDFADSNFSANIDDVVCAARFLEREYAAPEILIGHSLGGTATLAASAALPQARAVVTIGSPFEPRHVEHLITNQEELLTKGEATVSIGGRPFHVRRDFIEDLAQHDPSRTIGSLRKALLILHSPQDKIVSIDNAARIFTAAKHPKSFISLDRADHLLTQVEHAAYAAEVIAAWASHYLAPVQDEVVPGVRVVEAGQGAFAQDIYAGRHRLRADEPLAVGGTDSGPNPYELLMAALGACTAMTVRLYANHKQLPLTRVAVELKHDKVHERDCEECETRDAKIDRIDRMLILDGDLNEAQRAKLLEIADKCPVHRTLRSQIRVETRLASAPEDTRS